MLCKALWGRLGPAVEDQDAELAGGDYEQQLERRLTFSAWLSRGAFQRVEEEVALAGKGSHTEAIFSYLTGNRISEACQVAQKKGERDREGRLDNQTEEMIIMASVKVLSDVSAGDHRLSLLLSQAMGSQCCRDLLALQLADWNRMQNDCYLPEERLRIFALLAGKPVRCISLLSFSVYSLAARENVHFSIRSTDVASFCCCRHRCGSRLTQ